MQNVTAILMIISLVLALVSAPFALVIALRRFFRKEKCNVRQVINPIAWPIGFLIVGVVLFVIRGVAASSMFGGESEQVITMKKTVGYNVEIPVQFSSEDVDATLLQQFKSQLMGELVHEFPEMEGNAENVRLSVVWKTTTSDKRVTNLRVTIVRETEWPIGERVMRFCGSWLRSNYSAIHQAVEAGKINRSMLSPKTPV